LINKILGWLRPSHFKTQIKKQGDVMKVKNNLKSVLVLKSVDGKQLSIKPEASIVLKLEEVNSFKRSIKGFIKSGWLVEDKKAAGKVEAPKVEAPKKEEAPKAKPAKEVREKKVRSRK